MKKKIALTVSGVVVIAAIAAMLVFVLTGKDDLKVELPNLIGTWKVAVSVNSGKAVLVDNDYMVFNDKSVSVYREGSVYAESSYTLDETLSLDLKDISRKYTLNKFTDNYIVLYESKDVYMELIRYANADMSECVIESSLITDRWDVAFRKSDVVIAEEYLVFDNGIMADYRNGSLTPVMELEYVWDGNRLCVKKLGKEWVLNPIADNVIALIETDTCLIWELHKHN